MNARYCPQCGTEMATDARFCSNCGAQVERRSATKRKRTPGRGNQPNRARSTATRFPLPLVVLALGGLLLIVGAVLLAIDGNEAPTTTANPPADTGADPNIPFPEVPRIPLAEAKALYDNDQAIFVDVRTEENYLSAHVPDARFVPLTPGGLDAAYQELPQDTLLITYCT